MPKKYPVTGYNNFDLRMYDGRIGRWLSFDPMGQYASPYVGMGNNPVNGFDPTGGYNPIYDTDGNFLGTDNKGLQGSAVIMDAKNFYQGMDHSIAMGYDLGLSALTKNASSSVTSHFSNLKNRPDYDGFVTIFEGIDWAKSHPNALKNPTVDNMLYIDAGQLDFGELSTKDFKQLYETTPVNLFSGVNTIWSPLDWRLASTVYALGRVNMQLIHRATGKVEIINDSATDYDWNKGGGAIRTAFINEERILHRLNDTHGFKVQYYGTGTVRQPRQPYTKSK